MPQPDILKAKIAQQVGKAFGNLVFDITLTVTSPGTRTPGSLSAGTNPTETAYTVKGFVSKLKDFRVKDTDFEISGRAQQLSRGWAVVILGDSLPANIEPKPSDKITAEGSTKRIAEVTRDPAGATYRCTLEG